MKISIQTIAEKFILLLFTAFIIFTITCFLKDRPIIENFPSANPIKYWHIFLLIITIIPNFFFLFLNKLLNYIKQRNILPDGKYLIAAIIIITIIPRLAWLYLVHVVPINDYYAYHIIASELSKGNIIRNDYIALFPHVIGYPAILSVFYKMFGSKVIIAQLFNVILDCGIVVMLYHIGRQILNKKCGLMAAFIWSIWPSQIFYVSLVSTEALYTFLNLSTILIFIKTLLRSNNNPSIRPVLFGLLGVLCAITNAIRPIGLIMLLAIAMYYFIFIKINKSLLRASVMKLGFCSLFAFSFFLTFYIFNINISNAIGQQAAKSPIGFNMYVGLNTKYSGVWNIEDSCTLGALSTNVEGSSQEIHDILFKSAIKRFESQKSETLKLLINKHKIIWLLDNDILWYIRTALDENSPSRINYSKHYNNLSIIASLYYYIILVLCLITVLTLLRKCSNKEILLILIVILGMVFVHMLVEVAGRYHYPAIPLFSLIAAYGLAVEKNIILKHAE